MQHNPVCPVAPKIPTFSITLDIMNVASNYYTTGEQYSVFFSNLDKVTRMKK
jgi:hypothetical protein